MLPFCVWLDRVLTHGESVQDAPPALTAAHRRATLRDPGVTLAAELERVFRAWPLSGVLADLDAEPTTDPAFGGHPGLQLLYAERLVRTGRPGWVPKAGPAREWVERV